eukprot:352798_1
MTQLLFFIISILVTTQSDYYLSLNPLTKSNAETFCETHCNSELASIHSYTNRFEIELLLTNTNINVKTVWIGLYQTSDSYYWTDSSEFSYGTHLIRNNENDISDTTYYSLVYNPIQNSFYFNQTIDISTQQPFICNTCEYNTLTKFVYINNNLDFISAQSECNNKFGTSLASIHSLSDNNEAMLISQLTENNNGIYIGLLSNQWVDNTTLDYKSSTNYNAQNCVILNPNTNQWTDTDCSNNYGFICNMPSILCDKDEWIADVDKFEWDIFDGGCAVYNNNTELTIDIIKTLVNNNQKLWSTFNGNYIWKIDINSVMSDIAYSGVAISFNNMNESDSIAYQLYCGIQINQNQNTICLFIKDKSSNTIWKSEDISNKIDLNSYNNLNIEFDNNIFTIKLNDNN